MGSKEFSQRQVLCLKEQGWSSAHAFQSMHLYQSINLISSSYNIKMIIATIQHTNPASASLNREGSDTEEDEPEVKIIEPAVGWAYVGSHNFTPSAWGTLSGSAFNPILNVSAINSDVRP